MNFGSAEGPLRVAHLNSCLTGGGTDDQCVRLVERLSQFGHQVRLVGPDYREFSRVARDSKIPFLATPAEGPAKIRFVVAAAKHLQRQQIQIVHGHHGGDIWPTIFAARLSGIRPKIVVSRHLAKSPSSWPSRRFLLRSCDGVIAVSHFVAKVLREGAYEPESPEPERRRRPPLLGPHSKISVIHGGIDTSRFRPFDASAQRAEWNIKPEHFLFAVIGGYDRPRGKGQREFLKSAAIIQKEIPQARFLIVGRGNMSDLLEADIAALGLQTKAWLTPWCRNMPAAMNAIDCLVHPQIGTEAFALVVLEAFACGRPVIASRLDGIPEAFEAGKLGQLVTPESVSELAEAMLSQTRLPPPSPVQRDQLHQAIETGFSLDVCARKTEKLYRQLLAR